MGESSEDRIRMLLVLANMDSSPESVPINKLIRIPGTPLEDGEGYEPYLSLRIPLHWQGL